MAPDRSDQPVDRPALPARLAELKPAATMEQAALLLEHLPNLEMLRPERIDPASFRLGRMHALLERLGDPHRAIRTVHVAGSKGKGSVCEMLAAALTGCGYTVGLHTSPHLTDVRERIRVGGTMIAEAAFIRTLNRVMQAGAAVQDSFGPMSYFEAIAAMAFAHFAEQAVDVAVIEVGLGGRLDATNVITPLVSIITAIQLEHTQILGTTLGAIAREKAGIIKPGVPVLTLPQDGAVIDTIEAVAATAGAPVLVLGRESEFTHRFESDPEHGPHYRVGLSTDRRVYEHLAVPFAGEHQASNCGLVLAALDLLGSDGFRVDEARVAEGLASTPRVGRLERVWDQPQIVIDGAHTPDSIAALVRTVGTLGRFDSLVAVFGCAADKDIDGMLAEIARGADKVIFTRASSTPRAADPADLAARFEKLTDAAAHSEPTLRAAINAAAQAVGGNDLICVTGSFYLAGEAKRLFEAKRLAASGR